MRGPARISFRNGSRPRPQNEANTRSAPAYPAPYNGWNARGNLANMSPLDAIQMDNIFPGVQDVELRKGSVTWSTGFGSNVKSLMPYTGGTAKKLFASTATNIYDITVSGAIGASVATCTNGFWSYLNFANSGGNFLCMVNGADSYKTFDGTTWATPALTGVASTSLNYIHMHMQRLWFVQQNSMNLWYLDVQNISGALSQFPVGALFSRGGYIVAIGTWSVNMYMSVGSDTLFVIATSNGEIAVYRGTDPNSATTWSLVGVYRVPLPLGNRPFVNYGGDLLYLSRVGLIPMTKIAQAALPTAADAVSYQIDGAFLDAAATYYPNFGWQMLVHQAQNMLIVNVPVSSDTLSYQFVMNTITKAWCRFTSWNASCWAFLDGSIYFGGGTKVWQAWVGTNDSGSPIIGQVAQAYSNLGMRGQKEITLVRPNISFSGPIALQLALDADFKTFGGQTSLNYAPAVGAAIWDLDLWDSGLWDGGTQTFNPQWTTVPGELGYLHSLRMQITSSQATASWTSTDYAVRPAGIL